MSTSPGRRVLLLGGTFDPPHVGHLVIARQVQHLLGFDEVRLVVAGDPWQKQAETAPAVRLALVDAAVADVDGVAAEDIEVRREGPTYTVDTLRALSEREPDVAWSFLAGADAIAGMSTWHDADHLVGLATIVGVDRPGTPRPTAWPAEQVTWVDDVPHLAISSTALRRFVAEGRPIDDLVSPSVLHRIQSLRLYGSARG